MTIGKKNQAYIALRILSKIPLDAQSAYNVYDAMRKIKPDVDFAAKSEREIAMKYGTVSGADVKIKPEKRTAFISERDELMNVESADIDVKRVRIPSNVSVAAEVFEAVSDVLEVIVVDT